MIRTIFVPLAEKISGELLLDAGLLVAKRTEAHIRAMFIRPEPESALAYIPELAGVATEIATGIAPPVGFQQLGRKKRALHSFCLLGDRAVSFRSRYCTSAGRLRQRE
jgi:hypothetical protein